MKKITIVLAILATVASFATSPCAGGEFGGRRLTKSCHDIDGDCSKTKLLYWQTASCDWWCCPATGTYMTDNCGTWANTGSCCNPADAGKDFMISPNPLACAP